MPALVAIRFNPDMKTKYQAFIAAGKPPKVAVAAHIIEVAKRSFDDFAARGSDQVVSRAMLGLSA